MNIYQIFPRHFGNENTQNIPNGTIEENGCGKMNYFTAKALKAIKDLGITHIWYTGVIEHATQTDYSAFGIKSDCPSLVKGRAGSPYAIKDYYDIDPDLAVDVPRRMQEFEALVARTHKAGLQMIIDFVPNHLARQYHSDSKPESVSDFGENDNSQFAFSPQNNFYYIPNQAFNPQFEIGNYHEFPAKATGNDVFSASPDVNDWYETVKLNYGVDYADHRHTHFDPVPDTWQKMRDVLLFWAAKEVDGFRCDMAEMTPVEFWAWAIPQVKEQFPQVIFIAEVYNPNQYRHYIFGGKFDYLYDKVGLYDTLRGVLCGYQPASAITSAWQAVNDIQPYMLNFLENHDEQRIASDFFAHNAGRALPAMLVSTLFSPSPFMVYAGQELGERGMNCEGFSGRDGRTSIFDYCAVETLQRWYNGGKCNTEKLTGEEKQLQDFYKKILHLRLNEKAFSEGIAYDLMWLNYENPHFNSERQFAFFRKHKNELWLVVANFSDEPAELALNIGQHALDFLKIQSGKTVKCYDILSGNEFERTVSANVPFEMWLEKWSGAVLKIEHK